MIYDRLFSENIFHCSQLHSQSLAMKLKERYAPSVSEHRFENKPMSAEKTTHDYYVEWWMEKYGIKSNVAVIPLIGEMSRYSYWSYGNEFIAKCLERIDQNESFVGAVVRADTPGGTADSCNLLADAFANFSKPLIVQTNYCASAGVFVGSQANEIMLEPQASTQIGSIGTLIIYENYQGYLEKQGVVVDVIRAKGSEDKMKPNVFEELTEELRNGLVARATDARKEFVGYVKRGRAGKITSEEVFTGKMYSANDAIRLGLADSKGTLKDAVNRVIQLSK